jgi:hypothetical protein
MATSAKTSREPSEMSWDRGGSGSMRRILLENWWVIALRGILGIIFGLIALFLPGATILSLVLVFAAYMLVDGAFSIAGAIRARGQRPMGMAPAQRHHQHHHRRSRISLAAYNCRGLRAAHRGLVDRGRCGAARLGISHEKRRARARTAGVQRYRFNPVRGASGLVAASGRGGAYVVDRRLCSRFQYPSSGHSIYGPVTIIAWRRQARFGIGCTDMKGRRR